jgi:hypothetical protein
MEIYVETVKETIKKINEQYVALVWWSRDSFNNNVETVKETIKKT